MKQENYDSGQAPQDGEKVCVQYTGGPDLIVIRNDPAGRN